MPEEEKNTVSPETLPAREEDAAPLLSEDFFAKLLNLPACKSKGCCDNCGRCEH